MNFGAHTPQSCYPSPIHGRGRVKGATKKHAIYSQTPSPSYSKNNGDKMTDDKTTKELMKALIDYLRAKTEESKTDNEFTKSILLDEVKIIYTEEQSWPEEFEERWG